VARSFFPVHAAHAVFATQKLFGECIATCIFNHHSNGAGIHEKKYISLLFKVRDFACSSLMIVSPLHNVGNLQDTRVAQVAYACMIRGFNQQ
jgi:hypothetical protein